MVLTRSGAALAAAVVVLVAASGGMADMVIPEGGATTVVDGGVVTVTVEDWGADIGEWYGNGRAYVIPILLPTLPAGAAFANADLAFMHWGYYGGSAPTYNADLYGLPRVASLADVLATDHYSGPSDPAATLLQDAYIDPSSPGTSNIIHSTAAGDSGLTAWLNTVYAGGANAGQYAFLRLSPDIDDGTYPWSGYTVLTGLAGGENEKPVVSYDVVPEPTALLLLAAGGVFALRRRQ